MDKVNLQLVELRITKQNDVKVSVVISSKNPSQDIGVADCSKAHHALIPVLIALLGCSEDNLYMEVSSPGLERNIKNAAEFAFFTGKTVKVFSKDENNWILGTVFSSDNTALVMECEGGEKRTFAYENITKAKVNL